PKKVVWPEDVKAYTSRALASENEIPGISREDTNTKLKEVLTYHAENDLLQFIRWSTFKLPQDFLAEERGIPPRFEVASLRPQYSPYEDSIERGWMCPPRTNAVMPVPQHTNSRKRKSVDRDDLRADRAPTPPWEKTKPSLESRMTPAPPKAKKRQRKMAKEMLEMNSKFSADLEKRKQRFQNGNAAQVSSPPSPRSPVVEIAPAGPIVGTCQDLKKRYFRLTSEPDPKTVRPQYILEQTLELLNREWAASSKTDNEYTGMCSQFKSLRQDLTVQRIKNAFTVAVYETHARIALEMQDTGEYNQCQSQLRALYKDVAAGNPTEFLAYRILYYVYTRNKTEMNDVLAELTPTDKADGAVNHALDVRSALALGNYHRFFKLYRTSPNMGINLMNHFVERERLAALANMSKAYLTVSLSFLSDKLAFDDNDKCLEFLREKNAQLPIAHLTDKGGVGYTTVRIKECATLFENMRSSAFGKIDIKGQI
ncbi:hypothetical protein P154DRAFT_398692, partial [Amniculicola lignicola CBS 123094]